MNCQRYVQGLLKFKAYVTEKCYVMSSYLQTCDHSLFYLSKQLYAYFVDMKPKEIQVQLETNDSKMRSRVKEEPIDHDQNQTAGGEDVHRRNGPTDEDMGKRGKS